MMLVTKKQMVAVLGHALQASVKDKHLKVVAFATFERFAGEGVTEVIEHMVIRDTPNVNETHHHCLTFAKGVLKVTLPNSTLDEALAFHAEQITPANKFSVVKAQS